MSSYTYTDGAIHNDHHKEMTVNVSVKTDIAALMKAFMADDAEIMDDVSSDTNGMSEKTVLPEILCTSDAEALLVKLREVNMVDGMWQPIGLSNAEKGTLIEYIAEKLDIRNKWKFFGNLWHTDSETLRTSKARGLEQKKTWKFRSKLDAL